jgi:hypothetical protein
MSKARLVVNTIMTDRARSIALARKVIAVARELAG